jgi:hypothetical protein
MSRTKVSATPGELDRLIRRVIEESAEPLSATRIQKALPKGLRPAADILAVRLKSLVASEAIHAWPHSRFGAKPAEEAARQSILEVLAHKPLTRGDLIRAVGRRLRGVGEKAAAVALRALVSRERVYVLPPAPRGRASRYGLTPASPADYVEPGLSRLVAAIAKKGFSAEAVKAALTQALVGGAPPASVAAAASDEDLLVAAIARLDPQAASGALVYVPHVRVAVADRLKDKGSFDRAVLALAARRRVQVQAHPVPSQLSEREREAMVPDGTGGFFMAIGLRRD